MTNLNRLIQEHAKAKQEFQNLASKLIKEEFKGFFKAVPEVTVIKWTQYTPYFNDGDPCVFGVNEPTFSNASDGSEVTAWGDYEGEEAEVFSFQGTYRMPAQLQDKAKHIESLTEMICSDAMEEVLLGAFGDHAVVTVTADGIDVDEYEHD